MVARSSLASTPMTLLAVGKFMALIRVSVGCFQTSVTMSVRVNVTIIPMGWNL